MARPIARLKLGYFPLPIEEARNIHDLLMGSSPYAAIDPCGGDGTALLEITKDTGAHMAGIELDADRAAAAAQKGIATVHGSAFECKVLAETCSLLYLNPPTTPSLAPTVIRGWSWYSWSTAIAGWPAKASWYLSFQLPPWARARGY